MLRPLLAFALALAGCRQPPPEVRPAPPRHPAFGEAARVGPASRYGGPTAARGWVSWISRESPDQEVSVLGEGGETRKLDLFQLAHEIALSPDGETLAEAGGLPSGLCGTCIDKGGIPDIKSMLILTFLDGRESKDLLSGPWDCRHPSWSPDGTQIVFEISDRGTSRLWIVEVALPERTYVAEGSDPAWSPDGARIAYVVGFDLWTVRPDGTDPKQVTTGLVARSPSWSPDSRWIAFARPDAAGRPDDLWAASADGSRCVRLTWDPAGEWDPCWAPDGRLYFVSDRGGETALWVASPENKELLR